MRTPLSTDINPFDTSTTIHEARGLFDQFPFTHFPIVKEGHLLGNLFREDLKTGKQAIYLKDYLETLPMFFVYEHFHWLDILEILIRNDANVVPVLDSQNQYKGYFSLMDILGQFKNAPFLNEPGQTIVLRKVAKDVSFGTIAQIVESHNGKLLGVFVSGFEADQVQITLKMGVRGVQDSLQSFRRYGYEVLSSTDDDAYEEVLKERAEYLQRYLDF